jgi:hypothetical protein
LFAALEKTVLGSVAEIKAGIRELLARVTTHQTENTKIAFPFELLLKSRDQIDVLEQWILESANKEQLVKSNSNNIVLYNDHNDNYPHVTYLLLNFGNM